MTTATQNWHDEEFFLKLDNATEELKLAVAFQILAEAIPHVRRDTGFLANTGYVHSPTQSTFNAQTVQKKGKTYKTADTPPPGDGTYVGFAAAYARFVEERYPFLYPAMLRAQSQVGGMVEKVKKDNFG